jgi:hypothetical protein
MCKNFNEALQSQDVLVIKPFGFSAFPLGLLAFGQNFKSRRFYNQDFFLYIYLSQNT